MNEWNALAKEVDEQTTKQQIYDAVLLDFCYQDCENKTVLDFGGGDWRDRSTAPTNNPRY